MATSSVGGSGGGEYAEVDTFLNSINLAKYKERFVENGIEDEETILELNDTHLDALQVPLGHKLKMIKRIKTIRESKGMSVPQSRQGTRPTSQAGQTDDTVKQFSQASYSELPAPPKQD